MTAFEGIYLMYNIEAVDSLRTIFNHPIEHISNNVLARICGSP